jgi:paraquat-inducible protein B
MAEPDARDDAQIPQAHGVPRHHRYLSLVWIVPITAAIVAGWLAAQAMLRQGPTVTISFFSAEGLEPGITRLKYKDVDIGTVSAVTLSEDRTRVIVTARMQNQAEPLLRADTRFWIVRPRISPSSVSGLGTLFSGAYIGVDAGTAEEAQQDFVGLEVPPAITGGRRGTQYVLSSETLGSLDIGSPVYYRQVQVGQVIGYEIDPDGLGTTLRIFVNEPYDRFVKARSRFWIASGIDARFDAAGFRLNTESLVSILVGGIAFRTPRSQVDAPPAASATAFELYRDEASARREPDALVLPTVMVFRDSVRGLAVGAPVEFRGIEIGEVRGIEFAFDRERHRPFVEVRVDLYPNRLRARRAAGEASRTIAGREILDRLLQRGLAAQLRQGNLLTGQLYVALDFLPGTRTANPGNADGVLAIPTVPGTFTELQTTVARLARKLEDLPLQELSNDARRSLQALDRTLAGIDRLGASVEQRLLPEIESGLAAVRASLARAEETLDADAPTQMQLRATLQEVARAADAIRLLAQLLEREPEALLRGRREDR